MLKKIFDRWRGAPKPSRARESEVDFKALAEASNDVIFRCGKDGTAYYVSPSSTRLFGWTPEEMVGKGPAAFVLPEDMPAILAAQLNHVAGDESSVVSYRVVRRDGTAVWVEASAATIVDRASGHRDLVIVMRDITERKQLEDRLSTLAMTDGLTGLANRRAFDEALEREWLRVRRTKGQLSLLLIDLDRFKGFNDHYGHQVGDDCLCAVATVVRASARRPADLAARYGGEELVVILPDTDLSGAVEIGESIRILVEELRIPHAQNTPGGFVTISIGAATALSTAGASRQMPAGLLQAADAALYKAKHRGRNRTETALLLSGAGEATDAA